MQHFFTGLILFCLSVIAAAESPLLTLTTDVKQAGVFKQERWLAILDEPLVSEGRFVIEKNKAIHWQLTKPFAMTYLFDGKTLRIIEFGEPRDISKNEDPLLHGFFSFFFNIFNLSYEQMAGWFEITQTTLDEGSRILLRPIKPFMKKAFEQVVVIEYAGEIKSITIIEAEGDKLNLEFMYTSNEAL